MSVPVIRRRFCESDETKNLRVKVYNVALNSVDPIFVSNPAAPPGRVIGSDIAGVVDKVGNGVTLWKTGDRVAGLLQGGRSLHFTAFRSRKFLMYVESYVRQYSAWSFCGIRNS